MKIYEIINLLEEYAPLSLQESYDNAGLQVGDRNLEVSGAILCIDVTEDIVEEALERRCNLIISHHPLIFKGIKSVTGKNETERIIIKAIKNGIAIYSAHTNIDNAWGGVSHMIAGKLGLQNISVLQPQNAKFCKLAVFVPGAHVEAVQRALFTAGAGKIGNYDCCSYNTAGTGTFRAVEGANPWVGKIGEIHNEPEIKIEVIFPVEKKTAILKALIDNHPYEEPAFDIIALENESKYTGSGIIGNIQPQNALIFLSKVKSVFNVKSLKYSSSGDKIISKVAICGGSGAFLIPDAIKCGADVYITADIKYHDYTTYGNSIILADIGHYESEQYTKEIFYNIIQKKIPNFAAYYPVKEKNPINYL